MNEHHVIKLCAESVDESGDIHGYFYNLLICPCLLRCERGSFISLFD